MGASDSLAQADLALADAIGDCFADPLAYVLMAFTWGEGELAEFDGPDGWQRDVLRDLGTGVLTLDEAVRIAVASGHGIGKSALVAWIILWAMSTRPHLNGVVTANTSQQLESKTWRELAVWHKRAINAHWFAWTATKFAHVQSPETWFVSAVPWREEKSEAFAGLHAQHVLMIFDEASAVADKIWEVAEGATTTPGAIWCVFGNPTRNTGRLRECFGRFRHRWNTRQIDSRTCKMANKAQLQQWVDDYGEDSDFVRIRVRGEFPRSGSTQFIAEDVVTTAQTRPIEPDAGAPLLMGVDVARFGDDQSVIRYRRGRDARSIPPRKFRGVDTVQLVGYIAEEVERHAPVAIFVDGNGVGGGVVDQLKALRFKVHEVQAGEKARDEKKYMNKRAECWGLMAEWIKSASIDKDAQLRDDLCGIEYGYDVHSRIQLERKPDMKKRGLSSPDDADALSLTFALPVARADQVRRAAATNRPTATGWMR
jgi:hypothetical protein